MRVLLPSLMYSVEFYNHSSGEFEEGPYDIVPLYHHLNNGTAFKDAMLYMPYSLKPNQIGYLRISKKSVNKVASSTFEDQYELNLVGTNGPADAPLVFEYKDNETGLK